MFKDQTKLGRYILYGTWAIMLIVIIMIARGN